VTDAQPAAGVDAALASLDVAIAHDNLYWYGGGERIIATLARELPDSPFWAIVGKRAVAERMGVADRLHFLLPENRFTLANYRRLAPLYPPLLRARKLPPCDVLVTSSFAFAHHFRTRNDAPQLCFCYSPLRFAWSMTEDYGAEFGVGRRLAEAAAGAFRRVDRKAARRVDRYIAESRYVADQLERFYGRSCDVIYPPVDCERFHPKPDPGHDGYFLYCARLVEAYKKPSLVVDAFRELPDHRLIIAGEGPERESLEARATGNVEFVGQVGDDRLIPLMQRCAALVFPSRDDFGLVPVETMACGRPVLAFAGGGALETVAPGTTGEFFDEQSASAIRDAVLGFNPDAYDPAAVRAHAERWRAERFVDEMKEAIVATAAGRAR
jgi:glycosyltransferase involved in cell wall biosynthesis